MIRMHVVYALLDESDDWRQCAYRELLRTHISDNHIYSIREALNQELVLGRDDFKRKIEQIAK